MLVFPFSAMEQNEQRSSKLKEILALAGSWSYTAAVSHEAIKNYCPWGDSSQEAATAGALGIMGQCVLLLWFYPETEAETKKHSAQVDINRIRMKKE